MANDILLSSHSVESQSCLATYLFSRSYQYKYLVKKRGKSVALGHLPLFALDHIFMPMQISGQEARKVSRAWPITSFRA